MISWKSILPCFIGALSLGACQPASDNTATSATTETEQTKTSENVNQPESVEQAAKSDVETLLWQDLMPEGEDKILADLYTEFYEEQEKLFRQQMTLSEAANSESNLITLVEEGSAQDTMAQLGTYNVVHDLDGAKVRLPGYVVPLDFNAGSEYEEFLLVPYFGACLHTPPPPPNQIVFVKSSPAIKVRNIYEPVWVEGVMKTGKFGSDLGNSAYELTLSKLAPYEY